MLLNDPVYTIFKIGAVTAIGALIDFWMSKAQKVALRSRLETLWLKAAYLKWPTLGQTEAGIAIRLWDRLVGYRLFSRRRWAAAFMIVSAALVLSFISTASSPLSPAFLPEDIALLMAQFFYFVQAPALVVFVACSFSLTRFASSIAVRAPNTRIGFSFFVLLLINIALFLLWRPIMHLILELFSIAVMHFQVPSFRVTHMYLVELQSAYAEAFKLTFTLPHPFVIQDYCDVATNGVRISFSFVFFAAFLAAKAIRDPALVLTARVVESDRPLFTLVFGGLSVLITIAGEIAKLLFR